MKSWAKCLGMLAGLAIAAALQAGSVRANGLDATATYTDHQVSPGVFQYDLTLNNTGTTTIGTFWFGWVPGAGFLPDAPTNVTSPAGWQDVVTNGGGAILWTANSPVAAGKSVTGFQFDSTMTPAQLAGIFGGPGPGTGDPVSTAFVYIGAPFGDPGLQITAHPVATPEPGVLALTAMGLLLVGCAAFFKK